MRKTLDKYPLTSFYILAFIIVVLVASYWQISAIIYENIQGKPFDLYGLVFETYDKLGYEYINLVGTLHIFLEYPLLIPAICFGLAPTIAAITYLSITKGKGGLRALFGRLRPFAAGIQTSRIVKCYGLIILSTLVLYAVFLAVQSNTADAATVDRSRSIIGLYSPLAMVVAFFVGAFLDEGGLLEELGWRGFALPILMQRFNPLKASVAVGMLWAAWHLPREVMLLIMGDMSFGHFLLKQAEFMAGGISVSIIITYFVVLAGGSVVPAIMVHGLSNFLSKIFTPDTMPIYLEALRFKTFLEVAIALLLVIGTRGRLGLPEGEVLEMDAPQQLRAR